MKKTGNKNSDLIKAAKREKRRNYIILYMVTMFVWIALVIFSFLKGYFTGQEFIVNVVNNIIGILPPILIFDFFNEKLSRDSAAIEMSNKITETLMSNPETLDLFTEEQKKNFIKSTIASIVRDEDATEMVNDSLRNYLFSSTDYRIRTAFDYDLEFHEKLPSTFDEIFADTDNYFYVQEKLYYDVKFLCESSNNLKDDIIKIGFVFDNKNLDNVLREKKTEDVFQNCIFRETLDMELCDIITLKNLIKDKDTFQRLFKLDLQIDRFKSELIDIIMSDAGIVCAFKVGHDISLNTHTVRIIFHMPKRWNSVLEVALVDPVKAPKISVSYPEDKMDVEMYSFLSKGEESSLEMAHEHLNGIYDITISSEWLYPISGMVFSINRKKYETVLEVKEKDTACLV